MAFSNNLTQSIVQNLGASIVQGKYDEVVSFPTEAALCDEFGASRTVLREAVKMLTAKGLLSARPRQGTKVEPEANWNLLDPDVLRWMLERRFSLQLLSEYTEVRYAIEPMGAFFAAQRANQTDLDMISNALERMSAADEGLDDPLQSDLEFHLSILTASKNRFYIQFKDLIESALTISIRFTNRTKGVQLADIEAHRKIYNHILNSDPISAKNAMESIIEEAQGLIKSSMANDNE